MEMSDTSKIGFLNQAIERGNLEMFIRIFEKEQIHVNRLVSPFGSWLHRAADYGHLDIVKYLLSKGASVNFIFNGFTALAMVAKNGDSEIAEILVKHGANVNFVANGNDILQLAIISDEPQMINFALNQGFGINRLDRDDLTPLAKAASESKHKSLKYLLERGADYRKLSMNFIELRSYPLIHCLQSNNRVKSIDILLNHIELKEGKQAMVEYINHADVCGMTVLHYACSLQLEEVVKKLIQLGANTEIIDRQGEKPVDHVEIVGASLVGQRIRSMLQACRKKTKRTKKNKK